MISTLSDLRHLMHQIGSTLPEISAVLQVETDQWEIEFDEQVVVHLGWQSESSGLLLRCSLGQVPAIGQREHYAGYLRTNLSWFGVAPIRIALCDPDDEVVLLGEYAGVPLSVDFLQHTLITFLAHASSIVQELGEYQLIDPQNVRTEMSASQMIKA